MEPSDFVFTAREETLHFQGSLTDGYVEFDNVSLIEVDELIEPGDRLRFTLTNMRLSDIDGHEINMHICPEDTRFFDYESDFCNGATETICSAYGVDLTYENAICEEDEPNVLNFSCLFWVKSVFIFVFTPKICTFFPFVSSQKNGFKKPNSVILS